MKTLYKFISLVFALAVLTGCATHNVPMDPISPNTVSDSRISLFVDQDGTFYPDNWSDGYKMGTTNRKQSKLFSLILGAEDCGMREELDAYQGELLNSISNRVARAERVFVLIHGFNNNEAQATDAFRLIEDQIVFSENDTVIRFYWDGLTDGSEGLIGLFGTARIWNNAAGYSQLAGTRGLRGVLNAIQNKEIVVIAHSRGNSVVLSALSNPPYRDKFIKRTDEWLKVNADAPLHDQQNKIQAIFLAPAIGQVDFRTTDYYINKGKKSYRNLGPQLKKIHYTVNPYDPVLLKKIWRKKGIIPVGKFNPTGLGCEYSEGQALDTHYGILEPYLMSMDAHAFTSYVENCAFKEMLRACGVEVKK